MTTTDTTSARTAGTAALFSSQIREATSAAHRSAERSSFVHRMMRGQLDIDAFADLVAQHHTVYQALERTGDLLAEDPVVAAFLGPELRRVPSLESDLTVLFGGDWAHRVRLLPATSAYAGSIAATVTRPERFVANHYTRILGDLSGGQMIRRTLVKHYGPDIESALTFYDFRDIADLEAYRAAYRDRLDRAPWSDAGRAAFIDEVSRAYRCNSDVFAELDAAHPAT
jgi:heme oxygenase (biliverdin-producing, ferredoxin)